MSAARSTAIRVLVVDDHPVVRRGLSALIATFPGFAVAGEAADGEQAVKEVQLATPDSSSAARQRTRGGPPR